MASNFQKGVVFATVIDVIIALGVIIIVGIKLAEEYSEAEGSTTIPALTTTQLFSATTEIPANRTFPSSRVSEAPTTFSTASVSSAAEKDLGAGNATTSYEEEGSLGPRISGYYNIVLTVLSTRLIASLLIFLGHTKELPDLLKSHLDISIPLTIINFALYIFIVVERNPHKEFTALMALYVIVRKIVLVMEFLLINHTTVEESVKKLSVQYRRSIVEASDITEN